MPVQLQSLTIGRMPLRYGSDSCCIALSDSSYTRDIVTLRNDPSVSRFIHHDVLTEEQHDNWMFREARRRDSLNFVALVNGRFSGTASLYDIEPPEGCQYGRVVMPDDGRRIFAVAVEFLCLSFAFDVLQIREVYCRVIRENISVVEFHLRNGWHLEPRYNDRIRMSGEEYSELGMKMSLEDYKAAREKNLVLLNRLHSKPSA